MKSQEPKLVLVADGVHTLLQERAYRVPEAGLLSGGVPEAGLLSGAGQEDQGLAGIRSTLLCVDENVLDLGNTPRLLIRGVNEGGNRLYYLRAAVAPFSVSYVYQLSSDVIGRCDDYGPQILHRRPL